MWSTDFDYSLIVAGAPFILQGTVRYLLFTTYLLKYRQIELDRKHSLDHSFKCDLTCVVVTTGSFTFIGPMKTLYRKDKITQRAFNSKSDLNKIVYSFSSIQLEGLILDSSLPTFFVLVTGCSLNLFYLLP